MTRSNSKKSVKAVEFGKKFPMSRRGRLRTMAQEKSVQIRKLNVFRPGHSHPLLTHADDSEWRRRVLQEHAFPNRHRHRQQQQQQQQNDNDDDDDSVVPTTANLVEKSEKWLAGRRSALVRANATILINSVSDVVDANRAELLRRTKRKKPLVVVALDTAGIGERALQRGLPTEAEDVGHKRILGQVLQGDLAE